jgi:PAS domain S-box-containing protein
MHTLLKRQLRRYFGEAWSIPEQWRLFIDAVNDAYCEFDTDRGMLERSLELSSQELLQSNSEMRAIFHAIPDLLFRLDRDGTILDYEAGATGNFLIQPKELLGKRIQDVPHKIVGDEFAQAIQQVLDTRSTVSIEYCLTIGDQRQYFEARLLPLLESQIVAIVRNITERKQSEDALITSERRLADIVEFLPDATLVIDGDSRVIAWNKAIEEMTGIPKEDILGKGGYAYAVPFYGEPCPILIDLAFRYDPEIVRKYGSVEKRGKSLYVEKYLPEIQGRKELFLWAVASPLLDSRGNLIGAIESLRDITERKQVEDALMHAEEKYRDMVENSVTGIYQILPEGRFLSVNASIANMLGYDSREDLLNNVANAIQLYVNPKRRSDLIRQLEEHGSVREFEVEYFRKDKSSIWVSLNDRAVRNSVGKIAYLEGTASDITDRKLLRAQLDQAQKMEAIGTLAGGIAHDFNNILAPIIGYTELSLNMVSEDDKLAHNMRQVLSSANRAKDLVKQILSFSRKTGQANEPVQVSLVVREALKLLRSSLPSTIEICLCLHPDAVDCTTLADQTRIHQVLMNLCTNAAHAMHDKGGTLTVTLENVDIGPHSGRRIPDLAPGPYLKLSVADTGHGMDETVRQRIFDPYFTTKGPDEGTGLGLAVVYGIVKNFSGAIEVSSKPDEGAVFDVYLPRAEKIRRLFEDMPAPLPAGHARILVVDDEKFIVDMIKDILDDLGYETVPKYSSIEALETFRARPEDFDLVVTDMTMPHLTGMDLAREILMIRPQIPIILCTGFSDQVNGNKTRRLGIKKLMMKPVSMRDLAFAINEILLK